MLICTRHEFLANIRSTSFWKIEFGFGSYRYKKVEHKKAGPMRVAKIRGCTMLKSHVKRQNLGKTLVLPPPKTGDCTCTPGSPSSAVPEKYPILIGSRLFVKAYLLNCFLLHIERVIQKWLQTIFQPWLLAFRIWSFGWGFPCHNFLSLMP